MHDLQNCGIDVHLTDGAVDPHGLSRVEGHEQNGMTRCIVVHGVNVVVGDYHDNGVVVKSAHPETGYKFAEGRVESVQRHVVVG